MRLAITASRSGASSAGAGASSTCIVSGAAAARRPHAKAARFIATASRLSSIAFVSASCDSGTCPRCQA